MLEFIGVIIQHINPWLQFHIGVEHRMNPLAEGSQIARLDKTPHLADEIISHLGLGGLLAGSIPVNIHPVQIFISRILVIPIDGMAAAFE